MWVRLKSYAYLFWLLTKTDIVILRQLIVGQIINVLCWSGSIVIVSAFIFPKLGMTDKFGEFVVVSSLVAHSFWGIWDSSYKILSDIENEKVIDYKFTLPMPSWLVMLQCAVRHSIARFLPSLIILPVFKLLLGSRMDLSHFLFLKFVLMFFAVCLFTGSFFLLVASFVKNSNKVDNVGIRLLFPMWFFGATQYSWVVMYSVNSKIGYAMFANPLVYAMEGIHAAVLGQQGYLPFWICFFVLCCFTIVCGFVGIRVFKKRLDFV